MLARTLKFARETRPEVFNSNADPRTKSLAQKAGLQGWYGQIIDMGETVAGIEKVKKSNVWDFLDILNRKLALKKIDEDRRRNQKGT